MRPPQPPPREGLGLPVRTKRPLTPGGAPEFVVLGVDQGRAPIAAREELARGPALRGFIQSATGALRAQEVFTLVTCNRVECWAIASPSLGEGELGRLEGALPIPGVRMRVASGPEAFVHAVRVASGLDSGVWGEAEIATQVREGARASGFRPGESPLGDIVQGVLNASVSVRRAAGSDAGKRGAPEAAVELIRRLSAGTPLRTLVIGTGPMGRRAAKHAAAHGPVTMASRDLGRAQVAARSSGAKAVPLGDALASAPSFAGIVVALRTDEPVVRRGHLEGAPHSGSLTVVDLSFPRAVERPQRLDEGVRVVDLDELAAERQVPPAPDLEAAEAAAHEWAMRLHGRHASRSAEPLIASIREGAEAIRRAEVEAARRRLRGDRQADAEVLDKLAERLVNRILHEPTRALRAAASEGRVQGSEGRPGRGSGRREEAP